MLKIANVPLPTTVPETWNRVEAIGVLFISLEEKVASGKILTLEETTAKYAAQSELIHLWETLMLLDPGSRRVLADHHAQMTARRGSA